MSKKIVAMTGSYTNTNGETKNQWTTIGVLMSNDNGEYILLDPAIDLAGVMMKQRIVDQKAGKKPAGDMVMCSVFENDNNKSDDVPGFEDDAPF